MFIARGNFKGIKFKPNSQPNKPGKYFIGISTPKVGGFDGEEEIHEIKLNNEQVAENKMTDFEKLRGKEVEQDFDLNVSLFNGKAYTTLTCINDPKILTQSKVS